MIKINSQKDLDVLLAMLDWEDAFIRESHLISPSYINSNNRRTIAPDSTPAMRLLICTPESEYPGLELFFEEIDQLYLSFNINLNPSASFEKNQIVFSFNGTESPDIISKCLYYRILEKECWGWQLRYEKNNIFDESGFLIFQNL